MKKQRNTPAREHGQVLLIAVVMMVALAIGAIFLLDLQSVVRGKIKLETAEQAAALTASSWQVESLNLLGELNLIKACSALLTDIEPVGMEPAEVEASCKALTEMQSRVAFIGPLVGFAAAQQAAKNNGVNVNHALFGPQQNLMHYVNNLRESERYSSEIANGYLWKEPYINMLESIYQSGSAINPAGRFTGLEGVRPRWLADEALLRSAIPNKNWCYPNLNYLVKLPDSYWQKKEWWRVTFSPIPFPNESEIYTLGTDFMTLDSVSFQGVDGALREHLREKALAERDIINLPQITWCLFAAQWDKNSVNYTGPGGGVEMYDVWRGGIYLRNDLLPSTYYGGAMGYAETFQDMNLVSRIRSTAQSGGSDREFLRNSLKNNSFARMDGANTVVLGDNSSGGGECNPTPTGAVSKPIGAIGEEPPNSLLMILPVFTRPALIPTMMQTVRVMRQRELLIDKFLKWLADADDLYHPSEPPPEECSIYWESVKKIGDPEYRKHGYNHDFKGYAGMDVEELLPRYSASDRRTEYECPFAYDPVSRPDGAGWLQQPYVGYLKGKDDKIHTSASGRYIATHRGNFYLLQETANGPYLNNENIRCERVAQGGNGTHGGPNYGPPRL